MEGNTENTELKTPKGRETLWILGAFGLMIVAIFTIWQFLLKGKAEEERTQQQDTVIQVKVDTVKIKDSIRTSGNPTKENQITKELPQEPKTKGLTEEEKSKLKEKFEDLPKSKQDKIKKKLRTSLNK